MIQDAATELQRLKASGFVKEFANWPATVRFLGGHEPVLSKIGLIIRERAEKRKVRMVVDSKESGVSGACRKWQLIQLPTIQHAVWDHMELLQSSTPGQELEHMIADFKDAFFLIPNKHEERRYFVVQFQNLYYVFLKTAQGSKAAPLTWARVAALITRLTMSVLGTTQARINTYVDDPLVSTIGTKQQRDRCFALAILVWGALGLPLSLTKASRGNAVTWISGTFQNIPGGVRVGIKQDLLTDVLMSVETMLKHNQNRRKDVRSLEGKLSHISSLVPTVKPFLNDPFLKPFSEQLFTAKTPQLPRENYGRNRYNTSCAGSKHCSAALSEIFPEIISPTRITGSTPSPRSTSTRHPGGWAATWCWTTKSCRGSPAH